MQPYLEPWRPGIGDPTVMGWVTVMAYFVAAMACWVAARRGGRRGHLWVWWGLASMLVLLGINKQLDLQSWFTYVGKKTALEQGWYPQRRQIQAAFIGVLVVAAVVGGMVLLRRLRGATRRFRWALVGTLFLAGFIVIRAASFHHVDLFLKAEVAGVRLNWVLELGGIGIIAFAALRDAGWLRSSGRRRKRPQKHAEDMSWLDIIAEIWRRAHDGSPRRPSEDGPRSRRRSAKSTPEPKRGSRPGPGRPRRRTAAKQNRDGYRVVMAGPPRRNGPR